MVIMTVSEGVLILSSLSIYPHSFNNINEIELAAPTLKAFNHIQGEKIKIVSHFFVWNALQEL